MTSAPVFQSGIGDSRLGMLAAVDDIWLMKPFIEDSPLPKFDRFRGRPCAMRTVGHKMVTNAKGQQVVAPVMKQFLISDLQRMGINSPVFNATSLRKEAMIQLDQEILREARLRLRAWDDLKNANTYGGFNGMAKTMLEYEMVSDQGNAVVDMNAATPSQADAPQFKLQGTPLPITHMDFMFDARQLAISRNGNMPLDSVTGEYAGRRVAESIERQTIGVETGITYGGTGLLSGGGAYGNAAQVYGYLNFPQRLTKVNLYKPTGVGRAGTANGWVPQDTVLDVLAMLDSLYLQKFYGPFVLYHSNDWTQYLDRDYSITGGNNPNQTLRERLKRIDNITDIRRLDFLAASSSTFATDVANITSSNPWTLILVQLTKDVARAVVGQDITTVQWEEKGGLVLKFKVMCIMVPQLRATFAGNCGILHANASAGV